MKKIITEKLKITILPFVVVWLLLGMPSQAFPVTGENAIVGSPEQTTDNTPPVIMNPGDITINADTGSCEATVSFSVTASDDTNAPTSLPGFDFGGTFNGHTYFVSTVPNFWPQAEAAANALGAHLVAINDAAESAYVSSLTTSTFWIGLNDIENEGTFVWSNGEPVTYTGWAPNEPNNNGGGENVVEMFPTTGLWNDAKVSGVVPTYIIEFGSLPSTPVVCSSSSGDSFPVGTTKVTCTAMDNSGNMATSAFNITVIDDQAPTVITQDITVSLDAGNSGRNGEVNITADQVDNGSFDGCGLASLSLSQTFFDCSNRGDNLVTLTATDSSGNVASATATVTIIDTTPPTIYGLDDMIVSTDSASCEAVVFFGASVDDNCVGAPSFIPGFNFAGNFNGHAYYLATVPNFWTEAEAIAQAAGGHLVAINDQAEYDFVRGLTNSTFWIGLNDIENEGTFVWSNGDPVTFTAWGAIEPNNNNNEDVVEMIPSTGDWNDAKTSGVVPTYIIEFNIMRNVFEFSVPNGSSFPIGTTGVTFTATDGSGNATDTTFNVTVIDDQAPTVITKDITVSLDANGQATIATADIDSGSFDACSDIVLTLNKSNFNCEDLGINTLTLTASDSIGNTAMAIANVTIIDDLAPEIMADFTPYVNRNKVRPAKFLTDYSAMDNCDDMVEITGVIKLPELINPTIRFITLGTPEAGNRTGDDRIIYRLDRNRIIVIAQDPQAFYQKIINDGGVKVENGELTRFRQHGNNNTHRFKYRNGDLKTFRGAAFTLFATAIDGSGNTSNESAEVVPVSNQGAREDEIYEEDEIFEPNPFNISSVDIYPNPSRGEFEIRLGNIETDITLSLFNLSGQLVQQKIVAPGASVEEMGKENLEAGVYLVKIQSNGKAVTKKVIVK